MAPYRQFSVADTQKVAQMFTRCLAAVQGQWGALLGCKLRLDHGPVGKVTWQEASTPLRNDIVVAKMETEGDVVGPVTILLDLRDAITMAAILTMMPKAMVQRKRQILEYDDVIQDGVAELFNVMRGAISDALHEMRIKAPRIRLISVEAVDPRDRKALLAQAEGEFGIMRSTLAVDTYEASALYLLFGKELVEYILAIRVGA